MADDIREQVHEWADVLAKHPAGSIPAADVLWKLRQILGDPNAGVADASATYGAEVRLRDDVTVVAEWQPGFREA